jgi:hypothetical protein
MSLQGYIRVLRGRKVTKADLFAHYLMPQGVILPQIPNFKVRIGPNLSLPAPRQTDIPAAPIIRRPPMPLTQLVLLALIQGITEFLPVSSSGHLILLPGLTGMADQGLAIDVAVHVGTLFAVVLFFWADVKEALAGTGRLLRGRVDTPGAFLARPSRWCWPASR